MDDRSGPVTADDVTAVLAAAVEALGRAPDADWSVRAGRLEWSCWETVEHLADDLFCYAAQLAAPGDHYLPIEAAARAPGGAANTIRVDPESGTTGLLEVLTACGALLVAAVRAAPPGARGHHVYGPADAEASAAMGVIETVVHVHDVSEGLGLAWSPDPGLCARVLARLMPDVERTDDPWADLLWATGRAESSARPRRSSWRWHNT